MHSSPSSTNIETPSQRFSSNSFLSPYADSSTQTSSKLSLNSTSSSQQEAFKMQVRSSLERYLKENSISDDKLSGYDDPEVLYAVCIASKQVAKKKRKKNWFRFVRKFFCRRRKAKNSISESEDKIVQNKTPSNNNSKRNSREIENDLICNCPLVVQRETNGRRVSVSERHRNDRLMVLNACRKYTQIQNINQHFNSG